jgi:hypothetical protein
VNTVARNGLFGSRSADTENDDGNPRTLKLDRDGNGVDDRTETHAADRTEAHAADRAEARRTADDRAEARATAPAGTKVPAVEPVTTAPTTTTYRPTDRTPERTDAPDVVPTRTAPARASMTATLGLMLGLVGTAAALTGRLAPVGIAIGVLGLLMALGGMLAGARPHVAGRGLGFLGLMFSVAAVVFGILAMTHAASWLDSDVDQVAKLREWLDQQLPWMSSW